MKARLNVSLWRRATPLHSGTKTSVITCPYTVTPLYGSLTKVTNLVVSMLPSSDTDDFRRILSSSREIVVVLAGAGLSAGSGEIFI